MNVRITVVKTPKHVGESCLYLYGCTSCISIHIYPVPTVTPHHLPRPPSLPPKPSRMRKSRPRSVFYRKLFNGNMEAFIQVLAHLRSLSLHELSCLASGPLGGGGSFSFAFDHSFTQMLAHSCTDFPLAPCLVSTVCRKDRLR